MPIGSARINEILSLVPENIPFYRLQKASPKLTNEAIENTLFDRSQTDKESGKESNLYTSSFDTFGDYSDYRDYSYSGENFDEAIDETEEDERAIEKQDQQTDFSTFLQAANSQAVLTFTEPKVLPAPLFVEFNRAAIISLNAPMAFKREEFEAATAKMFCGRTTASASNIQLNWETKTENGFEWRKLELPMLGITANYAVRGDELILTNDAELLLKITKYRTKKN